MSAEPKGEVWSPTRMDTFVQCPKRFYYRYRAKLRSESGVAARIGTIAHSIAEAALLGGDDKAATDKAIRAAEAALDKDGHDFKDSERKRAVRTGLQILRHWRPTVQKAVRAGQQAYVEHNLAGTIAGAMWRGVLDLVLVSDSAVTIVDHKTGRVPFAGISSISAVHIYGHLARQIWPGRDVTAIYTYYSGSGEPTTFEAVPSDPTRNVMAVLGKVETADLWGQFEAKPGPLCNWCEGKNICPESEATK